MSKIKTIVLLVVLFVCAIAGTVFAVNKISKQLGGSIPTISPLMYFGGGTNNARFVSEDTKLLIGDTTTTTNAQLEVAGDIYATAGNDVCITGGNCLSTVSGGGGGYDSVFARISNKGLIYTPTTTDDVLIGATTTTTPAKLEVIGDTYISGNATTSHLASTELCLNDDCKITWPTGGTGVSDWTYFDATTITPTSTVGIFVNASSTVNSSLRVNGNATTTGSFSAGQLLVDNTPLNITDWDTAYSWGDWSGQGFITDLSGFTTANLSENTNLYYTDVRVQDYLNSSTTIQAHFTNADTAYSWGDWSGQGFITAGDVPANETDSTFTAWAGYTDGRLAVVNATTTNIGTLTVYNNATIAGNATTTGSGDFGTICFAGADCKSAWPELSAGSWDDLTMKPATNTIVALLISDYRIASLHATTTEIDTLVVNTSITGALTGNASTASALSADPSDCVAGTVATAIAANGNLTCSITPLISGGTLTSANVCQYDGTGIDCNLVQDGSGDCAAGAVCLGNHTHSTYATLANPTFTGLQVLPDARIAMLNSTTTNIGTLTVITGSTFPANDITDAEVSDTLTASNLVASGSVVADAEVDDSITINTALQGIFSGNLRVATLNATTSKIDNLTVNTSITVSSLANCDTIDTDANGLFSCGTDATGDGGTVSNWNYFDATTIKPTSTVGFFIAASSTVNSTLRVTGVLSAPGGITGALTGNASTASALAANPDDCAANTWATTIAANGNLTCAAVTYAGISAMTSANFAGLISDETGTAGKVVFDTSPTISGATLNGLSIVADGRLAVINSTTTKSDNLTVNTSLTSAASTLNGLSVIADGRIAMLNSTTSKIDTLIVNTVATLPAAAGPTVDAAGETAIDTTSDQFVFYGGAKRVLPYWGEKCFTMASSTWASVKTNIPLWHPAKAITVTDVYCETEGGTSVAIVFGDGTNSFESITCDDDGAADDGSITNGTFTANEKFEVDLGTVTGTVDYLNACITYVITAD